MVVTWRRTRCGIAAKKEVARCSATSFGGEPNPERRGLRPALVDNFLGNGVATHVNRNIVGVVERHPHHAVGREAADDVTVLPLADAVIVKAPDERARCLVFVELETSGAFQCLEAVDILVELEQIVLADDAEVDIGVFGQRFAGKFGQPPRAGDVAGGDGQGYIDRLLVVVTGNRRGEQQRENDDFQEIFHRNGVLIVGGLGLVPRAEDDL